jgi:signal transduction histidine kinase
MKISLRRRLLAVAVLGVLSCAISLYALGRIVSLTNHQRAVRGREWVAAELSRLQRDARPGADAQIHSAILGMRGGYVPGPAAPAGEGLDEPVRGALDVALRAAQTSPEAVLGEVEQPDAVVVVGARRTAAGLAWITYSVLPSQFVFTWRLIVASLTIATLFLVSSAVGAVLAVRRSAASLDGSLRALAHDLRAPVARPEVVELGEIAERIADLAAALAHAQTEKERLGAELSQRERLAALGRVVTGVAHEVRNPLASIKLRVDLGRARPDTPPRLSDELRFVSEEITRLDRLVADLLVLAGRRSGPRAVADLGALAQKRVCLLRPWAEERGVRIEIAGAATAELDADAVARAVDNLVRNAVEASPVGGVARIEVSERDGQARVRVLDEGPGVPAARAIEMFEPFFTTKPEGTGLGLALSRAIAAAHGGTLTYERGADHTCFDLRLPAAGRAQEAA